MKPGLFQQLTLYRYRYAVGYTLLILFGVVMLTWQIQTLGPGIADAEKASAINSATWQWQNWQETGLAIVNLPYMLLQKASIALLGLSPLSIRLPSVIIALATSTMFFFLMRVLHRPHIALSSSIVFTAASAYIAIGRFGAPLIMVPFVWVLLTYAYARLIRLDDPPLAWAALAGFVAVLACYTPYGVYAIIAAGLTVIIHPKIRRSLGALSGQQVVLVLFIALPLLAPLGWGLYKDPSQAWQLLGLRNHIPPPLEFIKNIVETGSAFLWKSPEFPALRLANLPLLSIGIVAILLAGIYRACRDWRSARTQYIIFCLILLFVVLGLNPHPSYEPLIVPVFLLVASGMTVLFDEWYRLFPRNPYARSFGLFPIVVLFSFVVIYHFQRYFVAWANAPRTYQVYDSDLDLVRTQLDRHPALAITVPEKDAAFYRVLVRKYPESTVNMPAKPNQALLVSAETSSAATAAAATPIVNDDAANALRFWLSGK